jgi:adenylate cyclase
MGVEIERKFLVADRAVLDGLIGTAYRQGYLSTTPERTVRVRHAGETAEFEYPIPVADVDDLLALCERPIIEKVRYRIGHAGLVWEVDVFGGDNAGLVVAEVEIPSLETAVEVPAWVGAEVTDDPRYFNANLVSHPFSAW